MLSSKRVNTDMPKEIILLSIYLGLLGYLLVARRIKLLKVAVLAFVIALLWTAALRDIYSYNVNTIHLFGVNLYALLGWSLGLLVAYILYRAALRLVPVRRTWQKLTVFNVLYVPLLIAVEAIAYHVFNVVNSGTAMYAGLPLCDCLHAPSWMKLGYLIMGSVYLLIIFAFEHVDALRNARRSDAAAEAAL